MLSSGALPRRLFRFTLPALSLGALLGLGLVKPVQGEDSVQKPSGAELPSRVYADSFLVWIYKRPEQDPAPIGYLRAGQSARLRATEGHAPHQAVRRGCGRGWFAIEPAGYICADARVTFKRTRYTQSMLALAPEPGAFPFEYALSMGTPSYRRVPTATEWERKERTFGTPKIRPLPPHWQGHEQLITDRMIENTPRPDFLNGQGSVSRAEEGRLTRRDVPFGSMLAVSSAFEAHGRSFLMSADGTVVPADRMRIFSRSEFEGEELSSGEASPRLPLAWPRKSTRAYAIDVTAASCILPNLQAKVPGRLDPSSSHPKACLQPQTRSFPPRKPVALTGRTAKIDGTRFVETTKGSDDGKAVWLPHDYLYVAEQASRTVQGTDAQGTDELWIHFKIGAGTLVVYRGEQPEFATLASPGIGGVPRPGADPLSTRTTPVGTFRIQFKHVSDDMSPEQTEERSFFIADVPYAMYFQQPFAIHVAYWHDSFGEPMSGGCINVSPKDGARLFGLTSPTLPEGWYGVGSSREFGLGSTVKIER